MKKTFLVALFTIVVATSYAQVPFFADPLGKGTIYGYADFGFRPGINSQDFYTYWQYGVTDWLDTGFDFSTDGEYSEVAATAKFSHLFSQWIGASAMIQPWFSFSDNFKFSGLSTTFILQGALTRNDRLRWLSNTAVGFFNDYEGYTDQLWYLGYSFEFKNEDTLTPMVGIQHTWKFDEDVMPTAGLYYTHKRLGLYLWSGELLNNQPRFGIAIDFTF